MYRLNSIFKQAELSPSASDEAIAEAEKQLGVKLPKEYVEFLKFTNGYEGPIDPKSYCALWSVEKLAAMNNCYNVDESVPGLLIFGSDGGGEAFGFDTRTPNWSIVQVPFVVMSWDDAETLGESFNEFIIYLSENV